MSEQIGQQKSSQGGVRKAVKQFKINEAELATPASVFAFKHDLGTNDVVVGVFDRLGRPLKQIEVTVQDDDTIVVKNSYDWSNGDKIVVVG
jgi:Ethanolamine utilization protein EutJ (predicted chaperonin)